MYSNKYHDHSDVDLLLMSYRRLAQYGSEYDLSPFKTLIMDEAHVLCNYESTLNKQVSSYRYNFTHILASSASILGNDIMSIYGMLNFLLPNAFSDPERFKRSYCILEEKRINTTRRAEATAGQSRGVQYSKKITIPQIVGYQNLDQLRYIIKPFVIQYNVDYNVIPHIRSVFLSLEERAQYIKATKGLDHRKYLESDVVPHSVRLVDMQMALDGVGGDISSKLDALSDYLHEYQCKGSIVYFTFRESMKSAYERFQDVFNIKTIDGSVPKKERKLIQDFARPGNFVFMTKAGAQSLNMRHINNILFMDIPYDIRELSQAIGRITRSNSKYKEFNCHYLVCKDTVDEYKMHLIESNHHLVKEILGGYNNVASMNYYPPDKLRKLKRVLLWGKN